MFELIFLIIIFYYAACYRKTPPGKEAIVRRNKEIFKRYRANQTFVINPFTDTVEFINPNSSASAMNSNRSNSYPKVNYINPMNGSSSSSRPTVQPHKGFKTYTINNIYTFRSLDGKPLTIKVYALFNSPTSTTIPTTALANDVKKEVLNYYTALKAEDISESATRHELTVFDILRRTVTTETIKLEKFEATPSNARITTRNTSNKTDCTHYDERTTRTSKRTDYSYSQGNAIKSSFSDTWNELNGDPISGESRSDNPIKENISINSIFEKNMIDVNNMDSNVDPIDNKY